MKRQGIIVYGPDGNVISIVQGARKASEIAGVAKNTVYRKIGDGSATRDGITFDYTEDGPHPSHLLLVTDPDGEEWPVYGLSGAQEFMQCSRSVVSKILSGRKTSFRGYAVRYAPEDTRWVNADQYGGNL